MLVAAVPTEGDATITKVKLTTELDRGRDGLMPDLRGLSARDANRTLTKIGMTGRFSGDGFVLEQSPAAGTVLVPGTACALTLGRQPPSRTGAAQ